MGSLRSSLSQYRKRKQLSLDGTVGGIKPNRFRPGLGGSLSGHRGMHTSGATPQGYMSPHPDAYEPHPGEARFSTSEYTPYHCEDVHEAPDRLDSPFARLDPDSGHGRSAGIQLVREFARWILRQRTCYAHPEPEREVIPIDHDPTLHRVEHAGNHVFVPQPSPDEIIMQMWERTSVTPVYEDLVMTDELFGRLMREAAASRSSAEPGFGPAVQDNTLDRQNDLFVPADQIPGQDDAVVGDPLGGATFEADSEAVLPNDLDLGPDIDAKLGLAVPMYSQNKDAAPVYYEKGLSDEATLEQIVDDLAASAPEPDPMLEEQFYDDDPLMNPWMMPGMRPMPPGL